MEAINFPNIASAEVEELRALATEIWNLAYQEMIGQEQIDYMLGEMYQAEKLLPELRGEGNFRFHWIEGGKAERLGFLAFQVDPERRSAFLDKLYLHPDQHGQGIGQSALEFVASEARSAGAEKLALRVNRNNQVAIQAYERNGFRTVGEMCLDIGGGFVMDDFWMEKELSAEDS